MERKTLIKIGAIIFIPILVVIIFNWNSIAMSFQAPNIWTVVLIMGAILAIPFLIMIGEYVQTKLKLRLHGSLVTKINKTLPQETRIENARKFINNLRETDYALTSYGPQSMGMELVNCYLSPSRDDAIPWDLYIFTTVEVLPTMNPSISGIGHTTGIRPDELFYVFENAVTGECDLRKFKRVEDAIEALDKQWRSGVKVISASEYEKEALKGFFEQKGKIAADKSENKEGDNAK